MARTHYHPNRRTIGAHQRVDQLVAITMRRFYTIVLSAWAMAVVLCYLGSNR